jgi:hypothetical protein
VLHDHFPVAVDDPVRRHEVRGVDQRLDPDERGDSDEAKLCLPADSSGTRTINDSPPTQRKSTTG